MNEPLVASIDLPSLKKTVHANIKELQKASDSLGKMAKKKGQAPAQAGPQIMEISAAAREKARDTSHALREAVGTVSEGSAEHKAVSALSEEFRQALLKFQQQVEACAHLAGPAGGGAADVEAGGGGCAVVACGGGGGSSSDAGAPPPGALVQQQSQLQQHIDTNESVLREREQGIAGLNKSVQDVAEIFQDLALLVNEQGQQIDNIQSNIENAATSTTRGVQELARASRSQRRARSRMCLIAACVLVILIILVMVLKFGFNKLR